MTEKRSLSKFLAPSNIPKLTNAKLTPVFWNGISDSQRAGPTASAAANEDSSSALYDLEAEEEEDENVLTTNAGRRSMATSGLSASTLRRNASWSSTCSDHVRSLASYLCKDVQSFLAVIT